MNTSIQPISRQTLVALTVVFVFIASNAAFWAKSYAAFEGFPIAFAAFGVSIFCLVLLVMLLFSHPYLTKPVLIFFVMSAAAAAYFMDSFGTIITTDIVVDSLSTTKNEGRSLFTGSLLWHIIGFGLLPSFIIAVIPLKKNTFKERAWLNTKMSILLVGATLVALFSNYAAISSTIRENREMIKLLNPISPYVSVVKGVGAQYFSHPVVVAKLGTDAKAGPWLATQTKPNLTVIVLGETARSMNFSLFGYEKPTNPELTKRSDLILFPGTTSCGTLTADSVPCMFSNLTRANFSRKKAAANENLLNVLNYAGVKPQWFEANTGSKGVAALLGETMLGMGDDPRFCRLNECNDGVLVEKLKQLLPTITSNKVIVLHQIGSHGPAYFMRYPENFKPFGPDCRSSDFKKCNQQEIINAYDNTIAFTDKSLAEIIDVLAAANDKMTSTMIYMSDHGESLGEFGLYLHGVPYFMAPPEQTQVPFFAWASNSYLAARNTSIDCMRKRSGSETSHDNFFHTLLGITDVKTALYQPELDVFSQCWESVSQ